MTDSATTLAIPVTTPSLSHTSHGEQLGYDRREVTVGIVHIGPGAFHRGHQAVYTHDALKLDPRWGICGVQMRSRGVIDALAAQDNLYTLAKLDNTTSYEVIGSLVELLSAKDELDPVLQRMAAPTTHIISTTVTEKGYCLTPAGELDVDHADIQHDLAQPQQPRSVIGLIAEALRRRYAAGIADVTVICCDNMSENGQRLGGAVAAFASMIDARLGEWISGNIKFPSTMVDSITPATTDALRLRVANQAGWQDAWPISREAFTQWVVEDQFSGPKPPWAQVGVEFTDRVDAYEKAKLRLLNGTHSSLAYVGLLAGFDTVRAAMAEPILNQFLVEMMAEEIQPTLEPLDGIDYASYSADILSRYRNPEIVYRLEQIAWDGSQKVPFRLLQTIADNAANDRINHRQLLAVAAWMQFVRRCAQGEWDMTDGLKLLLLQVGGETTGDGAHDVLLFTALTEVFAPLFREHKAIQDSLIAHYNALEGAKPPDVLALLARL